MHGINESLALNTGKSIISNAYIVQQMYRLINSVITE